MQKYEIVFVLKADQPGTEMDARVERVRSIIAPHSGEVTNVNHWGVRRLAYPIQHETQGDYMHVQFRCEGEAVAELDTAFRLDHMVLRHLTVVDDEWKARNEASVAKRRAAAGLPVEKPEPLAAPAEAPAPEAAAEEAPAAVETAEPEAPADDQADKPSED